MSATTPPEASAVVDVVPRVDGRPDGAAPAQAASRRRWSRIAGLALSVAALATIAFYLSVPELYIVSTDDAYVDAHVVSVVSKVAAYVSALHVDDNSRVATNALLVELDPREYEAAVRTALADLKSAEASADNIDAQLVEQKAVIAQSEAALAGDRSTVEFAHQQLARYDALAKTGYGTTQRWQQAQSDSGQTQAALQRDLAALDTARALNSPGSSPAWSMCR